MVNISWRDQTQPETLETFPAAINRLEIRCPYCHKFFLVFFTQQRSTPYEVRCGCGAAAYSSSGPELTIYWCPPDKQPEAWEVEFS